MKTKSVVLSNEQYRNGDVIAIFQYDERNNSCAADYKDLIAELKQRNLPVTDFSDCDFFKLVVTICSEDEVHELGDMFSNWYVEYCYDDTEEAAKRPITFSIDV